MAEFIRNLLMQESDGDGGGSPPPSDGDWKTGLPEGLSDAPFFKKATSLDDAVSALGAAAAHMGNSIRIPGEDASDEARSEFYSKILEKAPDLMPKPSEDNMDAFYRAAGRPNEASDYQYEAPEGREVPSDFAAFSEVAHKYGLSQDQFSGILGEVLGAQWNDLDSMQETHLTEMKDLKSEWGMAYDDNMSAVKNFLRLTDAPDGIVDLLTSDAMSADEIRYFYNVAQATKSSTELSKQGPTTTPELMTPGEAQMKISEMLNNSEHPYWNSADPGHRRAIDRMLELQKMANPQKRA